MNAMIQIIPVAAGAFVATNLDNFALLVAFLMRYRDRKLIVAAGYLVSTSLFCLVGYSLAYATTSIPVEYLGWLGLVPIGLGLAGIARLFRGRASSDLIRENSVGSNHTAFVATLTSQLGNGGDTIATFGALFADSNPASDSLILFTVGALAVIFIISAQYAVQHPVLEKWIENHAHQVTPFILIIVGIYIIDGTITDVAPD